MPGKKRTVHGIDCKEVADGYMTWSLFRGHWRWRNDTLPNLEAAGITGVWAAVWGCRTLGEAVAYSWGWTLAMQRNSSQAEAPV